MNRIPYAIDKRDFVGDKLDDKERGRRGDDRRACDDFEAVGQMDNAKALQHAQGQNSRIRIEAGGE